MNANSIKNRINIPIIDEDAYMDFYAVCKKDKSELINLLKQNR